MTFEGDKDIRSPGQALNVDGSYISKPILHGS